MKYMNVTGSQPVLAGIAWREKYNCYSATVAGWLELAFSYRDGGFRVSVAGRLLKAVAKDPTEAALLASRTAKALLEKALTEVA